MTNIQVSDRGGKTMDLAEMGGRKYPRFTEASLKNCLAFNARPDDIVLCTYPKSGTHWTFAIIRFLLAGTTDLPIEDKVATMLELVEPSLLDNLPSPRNLNTHCHFEKMSPDFLRHGCKIVYVIRDPRDVAVSFLHHHWRLKSYYNYEGEWKDYFYFFMEGKVDYETWFEYTKGWEKGMKEHPDHPFLVVSYEDMLEDPLYEVTRIADFIGVKHSPKFLQEVVDKTNINSMKRARITEDNPTGESMAYRKGISGDWKNWFTVAQLEYFNQVFEEEMAGTDAYKLYTHQKQT